MKPLICCSFLVLSFWACHERPASSNAVLSGGVSDSLALRTVGAYTGQFGKGLISVVVNYINGQTVSGYDIHKGLRRNFNGEVTQDGSLLKFALREPGSNPYDGRFDLTLDTASWKMSGKWAPFDSSKVPVRQLALSRRVSSDSVFGLGGTSWVVGRDSTLNLDDDGTCSFELYERPEDSTSQLITIKGTYVANGKECRIEWAKNDRFPSMKLTLHIPNEGTDSAGLPELRGSGMKFFLFEGD